jgi:hypothetical protein
MSKTNGIPRTSPVIFEVARASCAWLHGRAARATLARTRQKNQTFERSIQFAARAFLRFDSRVDYHVDSKDRHPFSAVY